MEILPRAAVEIPCPEVFQGCQELEKSLSGRAWAEVVLWLEGAAGEVSLRTLPELNFVSFCKQQTKVSQSKTLCVKSVTSV